MLLHDTCLDIIQDYAVTFFQPDGGFEEADQFSDFPKMPDMGRLEQQDEARTLAAIFVFSFLAAFSLTILIVCSVSYVLKHRPVRVEQPDGGMAENQLGPRQVLEPESYASLVQNEQEQLEEAELELERVTIELERVAIELEREQNAREAREQEEAEKEEGECSPCLGDVPAPLATDL